MSFRVNANNIEVLKRDPSFSTWDKDFSYSTMHAPWFIILSNHKWFRNLAISRIASEALESLDMKFPEPTVDINEIKKKYHAIVEEEEKKEPASGKKG